MRPHTRNKKTSLSIEELKMKASEFIEPKEPYIMKVNQEAIMELFSDYEVNIIELIKGLKTTLSTAWFHIIDMYSSKAPQRK